MPKLLVIDDDRSLQAMFEKTFMGTGFEVLFADTIDSALKYIKEESPEVIVIDRYMHREETGIQMVMEGDVGDASCILITASDPSPEFRAEMLSLGFLYVVNKPFSVQEMRAIANRALSHWQTKKCCAANMNIKKSTNVISFSNSSLEKLRSAAAAFKMAVGS
jgi:DNA-binding NtrC family response regulator